MKLFDRLLGALALALVMAVPALALAQGIPAYQSGTITQPGAAPGQPAKLQQDGQLVPSGGLTGSGLGLRWARAHLSNPQCKPCSGSPLRRRPRLGRRQYLGGRLLREAPELIAKPFVAFRFGQFAELSRPLAVIGCPLQCRF
jgi:hypothetical protein